MWVKKLRNLVCVCVYQLISRLSTEGPAAKHELQPQWRLGLPNKLKVFFFFLFNVRRGKATSRSVKSKTEAYVKVIKLFSEYDVPSLGVLAQFCILHVRWTLPPSAVFCCLEQNGLM